MTRNEEIAAHAAIERACGEPSGAYDLRLEPGKHALDAVADGRLSSEFSAACVAANRADPMRQMSMIRRYLGANYAASCGDGSRVARDVAYDHAQGLDQGLDEAEPQAGFLDRFPEARHIRCM
jgi:hypothetical protein